MLNTIKKVASQTGQAAVPAKIMYGEVVGTSPMSVRVDARFIVGASALVVLQDIPVLAVGEKVALLRDHGGQTYLVLGRI